MNLFLYFISMVRALKFPTLCLILIATNIELSYAATLGPITSNINNNFTFTGSGLDASSGGPYDDTNITINSGGYLNGTIKKNAGVTNDIVNINTSYNTVNGGSNTLFGDSTNYLSTINISNSTLTVSNNFYANTVKLDASSKLVINAANNINIDNIIGSSSNVDINQNYSYNTKFGASGATINTIAINNNTIFNLKNDAYVNNIKLGDNAASKLVLEDNSNIHGAIISNTAGKGTVEINTIYNGSNTVFGTNTNTIGNLKVNANKSLSINNDAYIDNLTILGNSNTTAPSLSLKGNMKFNTVSGINFDSSNSLYTIITLNNDPTNSNNEFMQQVYNLSQIINNTNITPDMQQVDVTGNNLYLNIITKSPSTGTKYLIDTDITGGMDFSNASIVYESIFKNIKLEVEKNASNQNALYMVIKSDRTPTTDIVSEATIISSNVVNDWKFLTRTYNENTMILNLQNIEGDSEFFHALQNITPDVSGLNVQIPTQSIISAIGNVNKRLNYFRMLKFSSINNTYNIKVVKEKDIRYYNEYFMKPYPENNVWFEAIMGNFSQDTKDNIFGYDADYYGGTAGYDIRINTNFITGISYTFNKISAKNNDYVVNDRDKIEAFTHNVDIYAMIYNRLNYLTLNVGGAYNVYDQDRPINFYTFNKIAHSHYKGFSYYGGLEYGVNILFYNKNDRMIGNNINKETAKRPDHRLRTYDIGPTNNFIMLTPKIAAYYSSISIDDYTERNADAANLIIKTEDYKSLDIIGGVDLTLSKSLTSSIDFQTILNASLIYATINDPVKLNARYVEDTQNFTVYGFQPNDMNYSLGLAFQFEFFEKIDLRFGYKYIFSDGFTGNMLSAMFLWAF